MKLQGARPGVSIWSLSMGTVHSGHSAEGRSGPVPRCLHLNPALAWWTDAIDRTSRSTRDDINFDSQVNAEDLGIMLAAWGHAPRNDYPPSDSPPGLIAGEALWITPPCPL